MGLFRDATEMARGRAAAIFLSTAVALVPAYLLGGAIVFLATGHAGAQLGTTTRVEALAKKGRDLPPEGSADKRRDILLQAREPGAPRPTSASLAVAAGVLFAALVVIAGLFVAQAVLITRALARLLPQSAVVLEALLDAVAVAILLSPPVFASAVLYLRTRAALEGKPVEELRQYIRRISEPG